MGTIRLNWFVLASALAVAEVFSLATRAWAHPDLEAQIERITAKLADQQELPEPYLQRADLYRRHAQYDEALRDLAEAAKIQCDPARIALARAKVFSEAGRAREALEVVQQFLAIQTNHPEGLIIRARCHRQLNQTAAAIRDFTTAIACSPSPEPDLFLERAHAQAAVGDFESAAAGLDEGMKKLGHIPSLVTPAIEFELQGKNFPGALARVEKIITRYPVQEPWLTLRGEILEQAGSLTEARDTFKKVLAGIETYPPARRGLDLTRQLEARARSGFTRVEDKLSPSTHSRPSEVHSALK